MPIVLKSGSLKLLEPSGPVQACSGIALSFITPDAYIEKEGICFLASILKCMIFFKMKEFVLISYNSNNIGILHYKYIW